MNEISDENLTELKKRYRTSVFIILAQVILVLILVFVSLFFTPRIAANLTEQDLMTLWVGLLFIAVGSFILRRVFFSWERMKNIALLNGISGLLGTLQRNSVILSFFGLFVGVTGFFIAALSGNSSDMLRAGAIAIVVFLINFPRQKVWKTIVSNLEKV